MGIVALANPLIYAGGGIAQWLVPLVAALLVASITYGIYALFFTKRAKAKPWPLPFVLLAWVLLALVLIGNWQPQPSAQPPMTTEQEPHPSGLKPFHGKLDGE